MLRKGFVLDILDKGLEDYEENADNQNLLCTHAGRS